MMSITLARTSNVEMFNQVSKLLVLPKLSTLDWFMNIESVGLRAFPQKLVRITNVGQDYDLQAREFAKV